MTTGDGLMMAVLLMATKFAVPVFIFITGMVLFYNDKGQHYGRFIKRRFGDIYVPFAVWTLITLLINHRFNPAVIEDWKYLGEVWLTGKSSSHFGTSLCCFNSICYTVVPLRYTRSQRKMGLADATYDIDLIRTIVRGFDRND